ncbi:MAG: tetratricopeptide repeat protein [Planctomycetes bacterium]|nr:tetratricopeptide repeat protein [Planctomycetota bacterium]
MFKAALDRLDYRVYVAVSALLACGLVFCLFTPRLVAWKGLGIPTANHTPEVNRAGAVLKQIGDPFGPIEETSNRVIRWRLLFPLLARLTHMPTLVFLALPHLGCLVLVGLLVHVFHREAGDRISAVLASALLATTSWFFVSTGWLTYADSWYLLGLLVVSFVPSRAALLIACMLAPWVDERFILSLPLALLARAAWLRGRGEWDARRVLRDGLVCVGVVAPYVLFRLSLLLFGTDAGSRAHLEKHFATAVPAWTVAQGVWHGLRMAWVTVLAFVLLPEHPRRRLAGAVHLAAVIVTAAVPLVIAGDISRCMSGLLPAAAMGAISLLRWAKTGPVRLVFPALLALNVVLPASNVVASFTIPIQGIVAELRSFRELPLNLDPKFHNDQGVLLAQRGDAANAYRAFDVALRLDPDFANAWYNRALLEESEAKAADAARDFAQALEVCPPDWPFRKEAENRLARQTRLLEKK